MAAEQTQPTSGGLDLGEKYKRLACDYAKVIRELDRYFQYDVNY